MFKGFSVVWKIYVRTLALTIKLNKRHEEYLKFGVDIPKRQQQKQEEDLEISINPLELSKKQEE